MNIQLYRENPSTQVSVIAQAISEGTLINSLNDNALYDVIKMAVTVIYQDLRQQMPENDDLKYMILGVIRKVRHKKVNIRDKEIMIAFQNGVAEEYGKYFGITVVSLNMFISSYVANADRLEALRSINSPKVVDKPAPTILERFNVAKINSVKGYENFLKHGTSDHYGSVIFDFFYQARVFLITQEEIDEIMNRGSALYLHQLKEKAQNQKDVLRRKEVEGQIKNHVDKMISNGQPDSSNPLVVSLAKRIFIDDLYNSYSFDDMTTEKLTELIEQNYYYYERTTKEAERNDQRDREEKA